MDRTVGSRPQLSADLSPLLELFALPTSKLAQMD